jgi:hypothetical protein
MSKMLGGKVKGGRRYLFLRDTYERKESLNPQLCQLSAYVLDSWRAGVIRVL